MQVKVKLESKDSHPLVVSFDSLFYNDFWLRVVATPNERVYGLGEQYSYLNLRGRTYPIWTREQGTVLRNVVCLEKYYLIFLDMHMYISNLSE